MECILQNGEQCIMPVNLPMQAYTITPNVCAHLDYSVGATRLLWNNILFDFQAYLFPFVRADRITSHGSTECASGGGYRRTMHNRRILRMHA